MSVGDEVVEVNGEECETLRDTTKIVALKMMIQQTEIREKVNDNVEARTYSCTAPVGQWLCFEWLTDCHAAGGREFRQ